MSDKVPRPRRWSAAGRRSSALQGTANTSEDLRPPDRCRSGEAALGQLRFAPNAGNIKIVLPSCRTEPKVSCCFNFQPSVLFGRVGASPKVHHLFCEHRATGSAVWHLEASSSPELSPRAMHWAVSMSSFKPRACGLPDSKALPCAFETSGDLQERRFAAHQSCFLREEQ